MFKNKDGSYNKLQLLLISLIAVIGIGIFVLSIAPDIQNVSIDPLYIIAGILIVLIIFFSLKIINTNKNKIKNPEVVKTPTIKTPENINLKPVLDKNEILKKIDQLSVKKNIPEEPLPIKQEYKSGFSLNIISLIITFVITGVTMLVGFSIINSMMSALPALPEGSQFNTVSNDLTNTMSTVFNLSWIVLIIVVVMGVISMVFGITKERY